MRVSNRYRLVEPLGEGGMGVVWRAYDELLDRTVAIKEVRYTGIGDAQRAQLNRRTIREARAAGRLDHPSVVVIHDVVEEDGRPWIVMQLVRSRSLAEVIRERGPLPAGQVAVIGGRVLDALRVAHATGVLHRDVKPENVLLADDGRVVLTDFGIAAMEAEAGLTATGGLVGTPAYMPPERLNGEQARPESDLWSLGATLYAAVEGAPPFKRDSWAATVAAVLRDDLEPPARAGVLGPVIMGLLRKDPGARVPAAEVARLLQEAESARRPALWHETADGLPEAPQPPLSTPQPHAQSRAHAGPQPVAEAQPYAGPQAPYEGPPTSATGLRGPGGSHQTLPPRPRRNRALWFGVPAAAGALAVLATGGVLLLSPSRPATPTPGPTPPRTAPQTASPAPAKTPAPTSTPVRTDRPVPTGWRSYDFEEGRFTIAAPPTWKPTRTKGRNSISIKGPETPAALIVEWTVPEVSYDDPARHWSALEKEILAKGEFRQYKRLSIKTVRYLGVEVADWEFTRVRDGKLIHVVNRGFRTSDGRPYAIYWETLHSRWEEDKRYLDTFLMTFRPR
ncbi:protein kinase [Nonomuraea purpurea]|uniref:non-specific serine/threonine protein kinase n=1 Tax=Nonomuraea purpurea TaxID=1849276 RepID=A0ABV8G5V7_9ACTN